MEWVETVGKTVEDAVEAALDQLGVAESDAEIVVVEQAKSAMFGLRRPTARVRARVRPAPPRPKRPNRRSSTSRSEQARSGTGSSDGRTGSTRGRKGSSRAGASKDSGDGAPDPRDTDSPPEGGRVATGTERSPGGDGPRRSSRSRSGRKPDASAADGSGDGDRQANANRRGNANRQANVDSTTGTAKEDQLSIETQQELAETFVREVVERFRLDAVTTATRTDDDGIHVSVSGENLGLLVGPKGVTVDALQELTRTVVQRHHEEHTTRIVVDVGEYRAKRAEALRVFVREAVADVLRTGVPEALEPMSPADRKVVHDTVNELDGVATTSEGLEPRRYVVIFSASAGAEDDPSGEGAEGVGDTGPEAPADRDGSAGIDEEPDGIDEEPDGN